MYDKDSKSGITSCRILIGAYDRKRFFRYEDALKKVGLCPIFMPELHTDRKFAAICAEMLDGLLLPGGGDIHPAYFNQINCGSREIEVDMDRMQFRLAEAFISAGKPVFGICKGMQVINVLFGGDLYQDLPPEQGRKHAYDEEQEKDRTHGSFLSLEFPPAKMMLSQANIFNAATNEMSAIQSEIQQSFQCETPGSKIPGIPFPINSAHHQAVNRLGNGLRVIQWADDGIIEGLYHSEMPVVGMQWHPERCGTPEADALFRAAWDFLLRM